jgi:hypothetical protein
MSCLVYCFGLFRVKYVTFKWYWTGTGHLHLCDFRNGIPTGSHSLTFCNLSRPSTIM